MVRAASIDVSKRTSGGSTPCTSSSSRTSRFAPVSTTRTRRRPALRARPERVRGRRVEKRHGREVDDQRAMRRRDPLEHGADGRRGAEEERARDPVDRRRRDRRPAPRRTAGAPPRGPSARSGSSANAMCAAIAVVCAMRWMNKTEPSAKPTTMASVKPDEDRQQRTSRPARPHRRAMTAATSRRRALDHVPGDDGEHAGERRERNEARERRREQHEREQKHRVQHAGDGPCAPARTFVAVRAIVPVTQMPPNKPDATFAAPCATSSQLRAMPPARHAVRDDGRQQRLDRAEQRERHGARQHLAHLRPARSSGSDGTASPLGMPPNCEPIVATSSSAGRRDGRSAGDGEQHAGPLRPPPPHADDDGDRRERQRDRRGVSVGR